METSQEIAPIDGLIPPPVFDWTPFVVGAGLLLVALIAALVVWHLRRRKPSAPPSPSARASAIASLEALRLDVSSRSPHDFASALSEVLRQFITRQFGFRMNRLTTPEFLALAARSAFFSRRETDLLEDFLTSVDSLRFGPDGGVSVGEYAPINSRHLEMALAFVQGGLLAMHLDREVGS